MIKSSCREIREQRTRGGERMSSVGTARLAGGGLSFETDMGRTSGIDSTEG